MYMDLQINIFGVVNEGEVEEDYEESLSLKIC